MSWRADIITLFPDLFPGPLGASVIGRGRTEGLWSLNTVQLRDFASDKHHTVDDTPSGGGAGNPAWDFVFYQRGYELNREFCFRARAVFRPFSTAEEVIRLYEQWSGEQVARPTNNPAPE